MFLSKVWSLSTKHFQLILAFAGGTFQAALQFLLLAGAFSVYVWFMFGGTGSSKGG